MESSIVISRSKWRGYLQGIILTAVLAVLASSIAALPYISIMGNMVVAIMLGITWRQLMGVPAESGLGVNFVSKKVLKLGIIFLGIRLNIEQIFAAGYKIIILDIIIVVFAIIVIILLGKLFRLPGKLAPLIGVGTGVCGAAAIMAVAPLIDADEDETALSVAMIAILGTIFTIFYVLTHPFLDISARAYGIFTGSTLHELAHVIAAAVPGGAASGDMAILVKLGRVALLAPAGIVLGIMYNVVGKSGTVKRHKIPIPWFIFGFLAFSLLNTAGIFNPTAINLVTEVSVFALTMAMAGLGLNVHLNVFKKEGTTGFLTGIIGSSLVAGLGWLIITNLKM